MKVSRTKNKKNELAGIRREYNPEPVRATPGLHPFQHSRYWFQQALRALAVMKREYGKGGLSEETSSPDPFELFQVWFADTLKARLLDPNAMTLSTLGLDGRPAVRTVLLKGFDEKGFVFFTNYESQKGRELARKSTAGLLFYWPTLARQVRVDGRAVRVSARESDEYFHSRPRGSQISAWVSRQSQRVPDREYLENKTVEFEKRFKGKTVARPPYWGGYRLVPDRFEFWSGKPNRLHDRLRYVLQGRRWLRERLSP
jgi:pyridoxamine 5'-phosphate oxidase